jgi:RecB family exonuclease
MGLDPEATHSMWMGSVIHDIIDRVQRREIERTDQAVHDALDRAWRPGVFPSRAVEHRRYHDARQMLSRWLEQEHEAPLRSEVPFEFALDGAVVRGRIDAIFPMENGHVRVVDYKTGRNPPTQAQVREDLQLASYYLAVKRAEELRGLGEPGYLQLAYLGAWMRTEPYARRGVSPRARPDYEAWATGRILDLVARIRAESFGPNPDANCQWCTFRTICPIWPEGQEAPV